MKLGISHAELLSWGEEEVELMLAYQSFMNDIGPNGERMSEATSPGADPNDYDNPLRYVAHGPFTNWAEKAKKDAIDAWKKAAGENENTNGHYWTVEKLGG